MAGPYDDIIDLPHHVSDRYPHMPMRNRAAQFAPFAAVAGHGAAVNEAHRETERRMELDESIIADIDRELQRLRRELEKGKYPSVNIAFFVPDEKKDGGAYQMMSGELVKIDPLEGRLFLSDGGSVPIAELLHIEEQEGSGE